MAANTNKFTVSKSKRLSNASIKPQSTSDNSLNSERNYFDNAKKRLNLKERCLKEEKLIFTHKSILNNITSMK